MELFIGWLVVCGLLGIIPAAIAQSKGREFLPWWIYGTLLWIVALIHALCIAPEFDTTGMKKCPACAEWVKREALVCKHCGRDLPGPEAAAGAAGVS